MNKFTSAIERVIKKRVGRGATNKDIQTYLNGLLVTWKNDPSMVGFIKTLKEEF